jgi:hypothetical protein
MNAQSFEKLVFPEAPKGADIELAAHIGRELAASVPGTDRHSLLTAWFKLMNAKARAAAHEAYDNALCAH